MNEGTNGRTGRWTHVSITLPFSRDNHEWKKLIMVHHWPATVCKEVENDCREPPDYWTIHGLWADKAEQCNRSWPFHPEEIKDLLQEMKMYWPDVIHPSPNRTSFWKHEWEKHGTCVAQLDALNSQRKYFGEGLDLYRGLALNSVLQKLGIVPSGGNYYQVSDIRDALASVYGVIPKVQCLPPEQVGCCLLTFLSVLRRQVPRCRQLCAHVDFPVCCLHVRATCARVGTHVGTRGAGTCCACAGVHMARATGVLCVEITLPFGSMPGQSFSHDLSLPRMHLSWKGRRAGHRCS
ncbi:PREDICTED: ribonuclease T2 isoform X1 [Miniopterus natalensis]|uniref:ribonuclease T2 isoform X1 n=1 Tax=Miniopterus natalensis TaxID=291302 RepID=UPI0007A6D32C|nr:PREDICTED: ribonuclease T2 isoform X1 [Miniopterus natalensis]